VFPAVLISRFLLPAAVGEGDGERFQRWLPPHGPAFQAMLLLMRADQEPLTSRQLKARVLEEVERLSLAGSR
jgi:hypothetical protein